MTIDGAAPLPTQALDLPATTWRAGVGQALATARSRATTPRREVVDWIAARQAPFTAEDVVADLVQTQHQGSRPTVYRTLEWLRTAGWLARVLSDSSEHAFARTIPGHYHHAVCTNCGVTLLLAGCGALASVNTALAAQGFAIQGHLLEVYGRCATCQRTTEAV